MNINKSVKPLFESKAESVPHMDPIQHVPASFISSLAISKPNPAEWMYERLVRSIVEFEEVLDAEHEIGARLVSFGGDVTFHIDDIGYWGPDIIIFYGFDHNEKKVQLLQHCSQLSVLLVAVEKTAKDARRIGIRLNKELAEGRAS